MIFHRFDEKIFYFFWFSLFSDGFWRTDVLSSRNTRICAAIWQAAAWAQPGYSQSAFVSSESTRTMREASQARQ